jgi:hypothetical protein
MAEGTTPTSPSASSWPSVDDAAPQEEGGPTARTGFNYQDEIAVSFLLEMLEDPVLLRVHCETHDDVLLVRADGEAGARSAEYVQVKSNELDKLWSVPDICSQKKAKGEKANPGTSIYETSLGRDQHVEVSRFRLVTLRDVNSELRFLKYPCGAPGREPDCEEFKVLCSELDKRCAGFQSKKGNGAAFWVANCLWDVRHNEQAICDSNLKRLLILAVKRGTPLLPEPAEEVLNGLRAWAKEAGDAKWRPHRAKKIITREALCEWLERRIRELKDGAGVTSGSKLASKMQAAKLPDDLIELAVDLRREYGMASRNSRYLELDEAEHLRRRVLSDVLSLRARYIAGQPALNSAEFHSQCVDRMDAVNAERPPGAEDRSAFLKGCMYDIADRCQLRFDRPAS